MGKKTKIVKTGLSDEGKALQELNGLKIKHSDAEMLRRRLFLEAEAQMSLTEKAKQGYNNQEKITQKIINEIRILESKCYPS